jgi:hypothetical protein
MVFEDHTLELLQRGEVEHQKAIDSYNNYEILSESSSAARSSTSSSTDATSTDDEANSSILTAKQLRQFIEENLRAQDVSEEGDHGKRFISNDDDYFESPVVDAEGRIVGSSSGSGGKSRKRSRSMATSSERMDSESNESNYDEEDVHEVYVWYDDADSAPMETMNDDETREFGGDDEVSYDVEFTDVTYM